MKEGDILKIGRRKYIATHADENIFTIARYRRKPWYEVKGENTYENRPEVIKNLKIKPVK